MNENIKIPEQQNAYTRQRMRAVGGGIAAGLMGLAGTLLINVRSEYEARVMVEAILPALHFLCSAVMTSAATIMALMLTLLSISNNGQNKFKSIHYDRVRQIARFATFTFAAGLILLLMLSMPLSQSQEVPQNWYTFVYYFILIYATIMGSVLVTTILLLYNAIADLVDVMHPDESDPFLLQEEVTAQD